MYSPVQIRYILPVKMGKKVEIPLCVYMDKGGRWFLGFGTEWRIYKMAQICHLRYLTMRKGKLNLHLVTDSHKYGYKPEQVVFRFRSKLQEERCGYNFEIKTVKIKKICSMWMPVWI